MLHAAIYTLNNWSICAAGLNPYQAPETIEQCLQGNVFGNPRFNAGDHITTTGIVSVDPEKDLVITRSGSVYKLGTIDPAYEDQFPDAKARLFASWPNVPAK